MRKSSNPKIYVAESHKLNETNDYSETCEASETSENVEDSETCEPVEKVIFLSVLCCMVTKSAPKWELTLMSVPYSEKI